MQGLRNILIFENGFVIEDLFKMCKHRKYFRFIYCFMKVIRNIRPICLSKNTKPGSSWFFRWILRYSGRTQKSIRTISLSRRPSIDPTKICNPNKATEIRQQNCIPISIVLQFLPINWYWSLRWPMGPLIQIATWRDTFNQIWRYYLVDSHLWTCGLFLVLSSDYSCMTNGRRCSWEWGTFWMISLYKAVLFIIRDLSMIAW